MPSKYEKKPGLNEEAIRHYFNGLLEEELKWMKHGFEQMKKQTELLHPDQEQYLRDLMTDFAETCEINLGELTTPRINEILRILSDYTE